MIYLVLIAYTLFMAFLYNSQDRSITKCLTVRKIRNKCFFILMISPAIIVSGLRYGISVDYIKVYERFFYAVKDGVINLVEFEVGFYWIVKMCSYIVDSPWFMFLTFAAFTIYIFFRGFEESKSFIFSSILFFGLGIYFDTFNGIRQYVVVAIFIYCFKYIKLDDWKSYLGLIGLSSLIHTSAIMLLPMYFLSKIKIDKKYGVGIAILAFLFKNQLLDMVIKVASFFTKYNLYIVRNTIENQISLSTSSILIMVIAILPCIYVEKEMLESKEGRFLYNMMIFGLIIAVCTSFMPFAERILYYPKAYAMVAIPYSCMLIKSKYKKAIEWCIGILLCSINAIGIIFFDWYAVLPYKSIFSI